LLSWWRWKNGFMHEMSIAESLLEAVQKELQLRPGAVPCKLGVRIGELAAVDPEALQFSFEVLLQGSELAALQLEIEHCPRRGRCPACHHEFVVRDYESRCPRCANEKTACTGGDELEIAYLEIEENEPTAAAAQST
jgi:hydrogenase nickel incorporation protein HypA/HybF